MCWYCFQNLFNRFPFQLSIISSRTCVLFINLLNGRIVRMWSEEIERKKRKIKSIEVKNFCFQYSDNYGKRLTVLHAKNWCSMTAHCPLSFSFYLCVCFSSFFLLLMRTMQYNLEKVSSFCWFLLKTAPTVWCYSRCVIYYAMKIHGIWHNELITLHYGYIGYSLTVMYNFSHAKPKWTESEKKKERRKQKEVALH